MVATAELACSAERLLVVEAGFALWQAQDQNGVVASLEIEDERGGRTIVTLA